MLGQKMVYNRFLEKMESFWWACIALFTIFTRRGYERDFT